MNSAMTTALSIALYGYTLSCQLTIHYLYKHIYIYNLPYKDCLSRLWWSGPAYRYLLVWRTGVEHAARITGALSAEL